MKRYLKLVLALSSSVALIQCAYAQSPGKAFFLGDSLTDCCAVGRFTQNNQPNYSDVLPKMIDVQYKSSIITNTAVGGATSGRLNIATVLDFLGQTGVIAQNGRLLASVPVFNSRDVVGLWIGTNDIQTSGLMPAEAARAGYRQPFGTRPDTAALVAGVETNLRTTINGLASHGLRSIFLFTPADLAPTILAAPFGSPTSAQIEGVYSAAIRNAYANLYTPGVNTYFVDVYNLVKQVQASPEAYGFSRATAAENCQANNCSTLTLSQQERFVYNDFIHFTSGFQRVIAQYAANIFNARAALPAQGDLGQAVGQTFSNTLLNRLDAYRNVNTPVTVPGVYTADLPNRTLVPSAIPVMLGSPLSLFIEGTYAGLERNGVVTPVGPNNPSLGADFAGATAGIEYRVTPNLLVGAAFNYLNTSVNLRGPSNGRVDLDSFQGGAFASYNTLNVFVDGAVTYGTNNFALNRPGVIDTITSSPDGNTLTVAGKIGYLFDASTFRVGPIAELTYANVHLGSYSERGDSLLTLGVRQQDFDGLTGGAGIQLRTSLPIFGGRISPFVNLTAQHDFLDGVRTITSFSTNAPALLINTGAGRRGEDVYGKVAGGFSVEFGNGFSGAVSGSSTFGRSYGDDYTVSTGLRYRF